MKLPCEGGDAGLRAFIMPDRECRASNLKENNRLVSLKVEPLIRLGKQRNRGCRWEEEATGY